MAERAGAGEGVEPAGPVTEHAVARTGASPGMGALIGIGAGFGMVLGIVIGEPVFGMIAGAAVGTVAGAIIETQRRR